MSLVLSNINGFPAQFHQTGKILTIAFIEASKEVITVVGMFGGKFSFVANDMRNNVNQLQAHYRKDESSRKFIEDMILSDKSRETHTWLLWLKRALELIERFFWHVRNDTDVMLEKKDNLSSHIRKAYDQVLKPYHGSSTQILFKGILLVTSINRSELFGTGTEFKKNMEQLQHHQPKMKQHIDKITRLYRDNNLNDLETA